MTSTQLKPPTFKDGLLPILISCRVRLSNEQREALKTAYYRELDTISVPGTAKIGASQVSSTTAVAHPLQKRFGQILIADLVSTRESISLDTVLQLQEALNVEVLKPEDVREACESYINYIFNKYAS